MNERFVHRPGCESRDVGEPSDLDGRCECWCHPGDPAFLDRKGPHVPGTDLYDGEDGSIEDDAESNFGPVTVITEDGTATGYLTPDDLLVVDHDAVRAFIDKQVVPVSDRALTYLRNMGAERTRRPNDAWSTVYHVAQDALDGHTRTLEGLT